MRERIPFPLAVLALLAGDWPSGLRGVRRSVARANTDTYPGEPAPPPNVLDSDQARAKPARQGLHAEPGWPTVPATPDRCRVGLHNGAGGSREWGLLQCHVLAREALAHRGPSPSSDVADVALYGRPQKAPGLFRRRRVRRDSGYGSSRGARARATFLMALLAPEATTEDGAQRQRCHRGAESPVHAPGYRSGQWGPEDRRVCGALPGLSPIGHLARGPVAA